MIKAILVWPVGFEQDHEPLWHSDLIRDDDPFAIVCELFVVGGCRVATVAIRAEH